MLFSIQSHSGLSSDIYLPWQLANSWQLAEDQEVILSYGKRECKVRIKIAQKESSERISISEEIIENLLIYIGLEYEAKLKDNKLIIGPVIGLLLARREERIRKNLHWYSIYSMFYKELNGLLFVYSEDQINFADLEITGYMFDETEPDFWKKCKLPFPSASYRRSELSARTVKKMINLLGEGFFNAEYFDKWQFWKWICADKELMKYIPETTNRINEQQFKNFIKKYGGVYIKPRSGSRGKGIHYIEKKKDQYRWISNYNEEVKCFSERELIHTLVKYKSYLLQEPIFLQPFEDRMVDYRVLLQKGYTGYWQCTGIIARFGKPDGITANFKAKGYALDGFKALKIQFGYGDLQAFQKYQEIVSMCVKIAQQIDRKGTFADFGIDIGIDKDEKVWIIEINKRHDHDFPLLIKNEKMYYYVKSNPLVYAKYVAMGGNSFNGT